MNTIELYAKLKEEECLDFLVEAMYKKARTEAPQENWKTLPKKLLFKLITDKVRSLQRAMDLSNYLDIQSCAADIAILIAIMIFKKLNKSK